MDAKQRKREFRLGVALMAVFLVVLVFLFMPVFDGHNSMEYMDNLYNSISKGSAYYVPESMETAESLRGQDIDLTLALESEKLEKAAAMFTANGATSEVKNGKVHVQGDLGKVLLGMLKDADAMYHNNGGAVSSRYDINERVALYTWWSVTKALEKELNHEKRFEAATKVASIRSKSVETAYNYYGVAPQNITDELGWVIGSLVFYVIYTLWYGFAILFMFEGSGFRLEH